MTTQPGYRRDLLLFGWLAAVLVGATALTKQRMIDWVYTVAASHTVFSARWTHLYTDNAIAQTGPLTPIVGWPLDHLGIGAAKAAILVLGLVVLGTLVWATRTVPGSLLPLAVGGTAFAAWWPQLGSFGHLDDALVLTFTVFAVWVWHLDRRRSVGTFTGLAIAAKPTGVFLVALTLPLRGERGKAAWTSFLVAAGVLLVLYGPFATHPSDALAALKPHVLVMPDSVLGLVIHHYDRPPALFRTEQIIGVLAASTWAVRRHGASAALWIGITARLMLDPTSWAYYTVGFVLGALLWDVFRARGRLPWATLASAVLLTPPWLFSDTTRALLRLLACLGAITVVGLTKPTPVDGRRSS